MPSWFLSNLNLSKNIQEQTSTDLEVGRTNIQICVGWLFLAFPYICNLTFARMTHHFLSFWNAMTHLPEPRAAVWALSTCSTMGRCYGLGSWSTRSCLQSWSLLWRYKLILNDVWMKMCIFTFMDSFCVDVSLPWLPIAEVSLNGALVNKSQIPLPVSIFREVNSEQTGHYRKIFSNVVICELIQLLPRCHQLQWPLGQVLTVCDSKRETNGKDVKAFWVWAILTGLYQEGNKCFGGIKHQGERTI